MGVVLPLFGHGSAGCPKSWGLRRTWAMGRSVPGAGEGAGFEAPRSNAPPRVVRPTCRPPGGSARYASAIESPVTWIRISGSGCVAGPAVTSPVAASNVLPWQGQVIAPSVTPFTAQP